MTAVAAAQRPFWMLALLLVCAQAIFCVQDNIVKYLSPEIGAFQFAAIRSGFVLALLLIGAALLPQMRGLPKRRGAIFLRSVFQVVSLLLYLSSIIALPLSVSAVCFYTFPIMTTLASAFLMQEPVNPATYLAAVFGFLGSILIIGPAWADFNTAIFLPFLAALAYTASVIVTHYYCKDEPVSAMLRMQNIVFLGGGILGLLVISFGIVPGKEWTPISAQVWGVLAGVAVINLGAGYLLVHVYQHAAPPRLAPFSYTYLIFAATADTLFWDHPPNLGTLVGGALTATGGLIALRVRRPLHRTFHQPLR